QPSAPSAPSVLMPKCSASNRFAAPDLRTDGDATDSAGEDAFPTVRANPLKINVETELDVELFEVFMGLIAEWDAAMILAEHGFIDESEFDSICMRLAAKADGDLVLKGYVIRAYFAYRKATKFLH